MANFDIFRFRGWLSNSIIPSKVKAKMTPNEIYQFDFMINRLNEILAEIKRPIKNGVVCDDCLNMFYTDRHDYKQTDETRVCSHCKKWNKSKKYFKLGVK
jgi:formylmethanofuran dehydrogenase subunit E